MARAFSEIWNWLAVFEERAYMASTALQAGASELLTAWLFTWLPQASGLDFRLLFPPGLTVSHLSSLEGVFRAEDYSNHCTVAFKTAVRNMTPFVYSSIRHAVRVFKGSALRSHHS